MNKEEILAYQAKEKTFYDTEIGKAFWKYESAHARYWQADPDENISFSRLDKLDKANKVAREEFVALLNKLMGAAE